MPRRSATLALFALAGVLALALDPRETRAEDPAPEGGLPGWTRQLETVTDVTSLAFSADGATLYGSRRGKILAMDPRTGAVKATIESKADDLIALGDGSLLGTEGHDAVVDALPRKGGAKARRIVVGSGCRRLVASPDEARLLAITSEDVALVSLAGAGRVEARLAGHKAAVNAAAWSPDGAALVTAGQDGRLCVHDAKTGKLQRTLEREGACFSGVAFLDAGRLVTTDFSASVLAWDLASGEVAASASAGQKIQGSLLLAGGPLAAGTWGGALKLFDAKDLSPLGEVAVTELVGEIAASRDGERLAFLSGVVNHVLHTFARGKAAEAGGAAGGGAAAGGAGGAAAGPFVGTIPAGGRAIAFSADGRTLLFTEGSEFRAYDLSKGVPAARRLGDATLAAIQRDRLAFIAAKGDRALVVEDMTLLELDAAGQKVGSTPLGAKGDGVEGAALFPSASGAHVAVARRKGEDALVEVWEVGSPSKSLVSFTAKDVPRRTPFALTTDGLRLAAATLEGKSFEVWDVRKKRIAATLQGGCEVALAFGPKGDTVFAVGAQEVTVFSLKTGTKAGAVKLPAKPRTAVLSPDRKRVAMTGDDGALLVVDLASGKTVLTEKDVSETGVIALEAIAWAPDGKRVAITSRDKEETRVLAVP